MAGTKPGNALVQAAGNNFQKSIIWAVSLIISLPFLIAAYRKIKALSMILAEFTVSHQMNRRLTDKTRGIISEIIPAIFLVIITILVSLLSAGILPPLELLFLILFFVGLLVLFVWPWFIRIHSTLQISLMKSIKWDDVDKK